MRTSNINIHTQMITLRFQTMPIMRDCSSQETSHRQPDCSATKLCVESCRDGYRLGDVDSSGCRSCTCVRAGKLSHFKFKTCLFRFNIFSLTLFKVAHETCNH